MQILKIINLSLRGEKSLMNKRCFLGCDFGRIKILDSHNSIDSIGSIDCVDSIDSIESEDSTDSMDSRDFIDSVDSILMPHKRPPTFSPHTKSRADSTDGGKPTSVVSFSLCVWCESRRFFFVARV